MKEFIVQFWKPSDIPMGVRVLTWSTSIRWFGWGIGESLIPIFLFMFTSSYAQSGLLKSTYDLALIIMLPIAGIIADRTRATTIIMIGLSMYVVVGAGYWLAGLTGMAIFIVIARLFNGVGYSLDAVGRETYFRRHVPKEKLATVFGYFDTFANFWWIIAALFGVIVSRFLSIGNMLFFIVPTVIVSMIVVGWFRRHEPKEVVSKDSSEIPNRNLLREIINWQGNLKLVAILNFFISFAVSVVTFFLPIQLYTEGAGYTAVIIMGITMTLPSLIGWPLGKIFDRQGIKAFGFGLGGLAVLLFGLAFAKMYLLQMIIGFLIGVIVELLWLGSQELMTVYTTPEHFGRTDGLVRSINNMGSLAGPIIIGIVMDTWGAAYGYAGLGILMALLMGCFMVVMRMSTQRKTISI